LGVVLGYSALVLILAQGGLTTRMSQLRPVMWPAIALASIGVIVSIAVVALPLIAFLDVEPRIAIIFGAVLAATDAAAVFSVLRRTPIAARIRTMLEAEAGFNDAPVVVIVVVLASAEFGADPWWWIALQIAFELVAGAAVGVAVGYAGRWLLPRLALPAVGLYPIAAFAILVLAYGLADVAHASGFLAVYVAAVIIGSTKRLPHRRSILGFADGLAQTAEIGLFIMLGLLADVSRLGEAWALALVAGLLLVLIARPVAAAASLLPFRTPWRVVAFTGVAGLRGAVPIVFAAIPLGLAIPGATTLFDATMLIVLALLVLQAPVLGRIARFLRLQEPAQAIELEVESAPLDGINAVVLAVDVPGGSGLVGTYVSELGLPHGAVVSLIVRGAEVVGIDEHARIRRGDRLLVVCTEEAWSVAQVRLRSVAQGGRLATWIRAPEPEDPFKRGR
jgi:cell volume regulation protein A